MGYNYCEKCFNPNKCEEVCGVCEHNPKNVFTKDNFLDYPICCQFGYKNCIRDPGYIWVFDREWFIELYGDVNPTEVNSCEDCNDGSRYDDEDK